jgi:hypothetical protein
MKIIFFSISLIISQLTFASRPIPAQDLNCFDGDSTLEISIYEDLRGLDNNAYTLEVKTPWLKETEVKFVTEAGPDEEVTDLISGPKREILVSRQEAYPVYVARNQKGQMVQITLNGVGQEKGVLGADVVLALDQTIYVETLSCKAKRRF